MRRRTLWPSRQVGRHAQAVSFAHATVCATFTADPSAFACPAYNGSRVIDLISPHFLTSTLSPSSSSSLHITEMSARDYYKHSSKRDALPPIRDVLGDQLDRPPHHDAAYSFDAVHRALPSTTGQSQSRSRSTWPQSSGPTLPPIYHSHAQGYASAGPTTPSYPYHSSSSSQAHGRSSSHSHSQSSHSQQSSSHRSSDVPVTPPQSGSAPYSFDVFRPTSSGLVHASSSSRSQGILRSTRADAGKRHAPPPPLDEDDDHEDDMASSSKRYPCPYCGKRFSRPSSLKTHEIVHSDEKPYECPHPGCGKTFTVPSNMRRHYRKTHADPSSGGHSGSGDDEEDNYYQDAAPSSSSRYFSSSARGSSSAGATSGSAQYYSSSRR